MANYYRVKAERYEKLRRQAAANRPLSNTKTHFMQKLRLRARGEHERKTWYFRRWLRTLTKGPVDSGQPCECGRNHNALKVINGETVLICPVLFYMNCVRLHTDTKDLAQWSKEHPMTDFLFRTDPEKDATYRKELEYEGFQGDLAEMSRTGRGSAKDVSESSS